MEFDSGKSNNLVAVSIINKKYAQRKLPSQKHQQMKQLFFLALTVLYLSSCKDNNSSTNTTPVPAVNTQPADENVRISYSVINQLPHDTNAFTEGLFVHKGQLFESTGAPEGMDQTRSLFGILNLKTGKIDVKAELDKQVYFGEGIVMLDNKIYQLTYKNQVCFVYDATTFKRVGQFTYVNKEGWGLTTDGKYLIMSDGTNILSFIDPKDFKVVKSLSVTANGYAMDHLNELEYIKGFIYSNVWTTNSIVKIDPATGHVVGNLDLTPLKGQATAKYAESLELNGIAYDADSDRVYVTGKMWPVMYQIGFSH